MKYASALAAAAAVAVLGAAASAGTLDIVKARGFVRCGVNHGLPGFSSRDERGDWSGMDVDVCRAIAGAMFGDPEKVRYTPLSARDRFQALKADEIDVLSRNTTWTLVRDAAGLEFAAVNYYDGQAFMVRKNLGVKDALELDGATVCVTLGTTTALNLADYFRVNNMAYRAREFQRTDEALAAYDQGGCDVFTTDQSGLYALRTTLKDPDAHVVLPEVISKEPLGPVVSQPGCEDLGDNQWVDVVRWSVYAMLEAEELGVDSKNVNELRANSQRPTIRRLLGVEGEMGKKLGLPDDWAYNIIRLVGNYNESFERNLGPGTPLKIPRGLNALWKDGGIQYPMPVR